MADKYEPSIETLMLETGVSLLDTPSPTTEAAPASGAALAASKDEMCVVCMETRAIYVYEDEPMVIHVARYGNAERAIAARFVTKPGSARDGHFKAEEGVVRFAPRQIIAQVPIRAAGWGGARVGARGAGDSDDDQWNPIRRFVVELQTVGFGDEPPPPPPPRKTRAGDGASPASRAAVTPTEAPEASDSLEEVRWHARVRAAAAAVACGAGGRGPRPFSLSLRARATAIVRDAARARFRFPSLARSRAVHARRATHRQAQGELRVRA